MASNTEVVVYKPGDLVTFTILIYRGLGIVKRHCYPGSGAGPTFNPRERIEVVPVGHLDWTPISLQQEEVELLQRAPDNQLVE